jgi:hypothetical protein
MLLCGFVGIGGIAVLAAVRAKTPPSVEPVDPV